MCHSEIGVGIYGEDHIVKSVGNNSSLGIGKADKNKGADNLGISINIAEINGRADNLGTDTNITNIDRETEDLGISSDIIDVDNRADLDIGKVIANVDGKMDVPDIVTNIADADREANANTGIGRVDANSLLSSFIFSLSLLTLVK